MNDLEICQLAMSWLGARQPQNITSPSTTEENLCATNFPISRDAVLEEGEFTASIIRAKLTGGTDVSGSHEFGWKHALPTGYLRMLQAGAQENFRDRAVWVVEGKDLYINVEEPFTRYIQTVVDANDLSPSIASAIAARMAAELAVPITNSAKVEERRWAIYANKLLEAMQNDGRVGKHRILTSDALIRARFSYGRGGYMGPYV